MQVNKIEKSIKNKYKKCEKLRIENSVFKKLKDLETYSLGNRLENLKRLVNVEIIKEEELVDKLKNVSESIEAWEWCNKT